MHYSLYEMGCILVMYSFLGWVSEVAYAAVKRGIFVNRGFLNGPVCPIYGFGVLIVLLVLEPIKERLLILFFGSMLLTTALEFITGFVLERFFHDKWWDYSNTPFNIKGYVCLGASIAWGLACVLIVDVVHPFIMGFINLIPQFVGKWILLGLMIIFVSDGVLTLMTVLKMPKRLKAMGELEKKIHSVSDSMGENIYESVEWSRERTEAFDEKHPEFAEKKKAASRELRTKRAELEAKNKERMQAVREKEQEKKEAVAKHRAELEAKLEKLADNFVQKRIARAYPQLRDGENYGESFRKLNNYLDELKNKKKAARAAKKESKKEDKK